MKGRVQWKGWALIALPVLALAASTASLAALVWRSGPLMSLEAIGFAESHDKRAFALLAGGAPAARAEAEDREALALSPYQNTARLRLAYAYALSGPPADRLAIEQLAVSYDLMPYDYTVAAWRIAFALENWGRIPPDLRRAVYAEAMAFGRAHSRDVAVPAVLKSIRDPEGGLAAALWLQALKE